MPPYEAECTTCREPLEHADNPEQLKSILIGHSHTEKSIEQLGHINFLVKETDENGKIVIRYFLRVRPKDDSVMYSFSGKHYPPDEPHYL